MPPTVELDWSGNVLPRLVRMWNQSGQSDGLVMPYFRSAFPGDEYRLNLGRKSFGAEYNLSNPPMEEAGGKT